MIPYTVHNGWYIFPDELYQLRVSQVSRDRFNRIFAYVTVQTHDGSAYLGMDHGDLTSGQFRNRLAAQSAQRNSGDTLKIENLIFAAVLALQQDPAISTTTPAPAFRQVEEFIRGVLPAGPFVVEGLIDRGGLYTVVSKPKVAKTILLCNLALAIAHGSDWLGHAVSNGRVCMFQLEDSSRTLKKRLEKMTGDRWPRDFWLHVDPFRLSVENYEATVDACRGASLIICDPIIQASEVRDWNAQSEVRETYELWRRLARDTDAGVVVAAHHRKMTGDYGDQMAGSIQAQATVDGIIEIYRDANLAKTERKLSFTGRDWSDREDEVISLDTETLTWGSAGSFVEAQEMGREMAKQERLRDKMSEVWDALPVEGPGLTYPELVDLTELSRDRIREAVRALGEKVAREGNPRSRTNPLRLWRSESSVVDM